MVVGTLTMWRSSLRIWEQKAAMSKSNSYRMERMCPCVIKKHIRKELKCNFPLLYLSFTGQGRHVRSPSMEEKTMVGRCFLNLRPFFSRWLFSATYISPCWTLPDIRDTSSPWTTTSCSDRTNTSRSSSSRRSISLMTRWRSSTSRRRRRAASNSMLELGVTSLDEGAVAAADGGSERASRASVTRRKSPIEMERLVAGEATARTAEEDADGGMAGRGRGGEEGDEEGEPGGWRSGCGSLFSIAAAAAMSPLVTLSQLFLCSRFMATVPLLLFAVSVAGVNLPFLLLLRQSGDVRRSGWKQSHSWIRDLSRESAEAFRVCACARCQGGACMAADDWAALLFAADAAVVSCFVVVSFISGQNRPDTHLPLSLSLAPSFSLTLDSLCSPLLSAAAKFPSFSFSHSRLPLTTHSASDGKLRREGWCSKFFLTFITLASSPLFGIHAVTRSLCSWPI